MSENPDEPEVRRPDEPDPNEQQCEVGYCDLPVQSFPAAIDVPVISPLPISGEAVLCDQHHVAAVILKLTLEEPPYIRGPGEFEQVAYYARALAATVWDIDPGKTVMAPQQMDE